MSIKINEATGKNYGPPLVTYTFPTSITRPFFLPNPKCPKRALGSDILKLFNPPQASQADLLSCPIFPHLICGWENWARLGRLLLLICSRVQFFPSCPIFPRPPRRLGGKIGHVNRSSHVQFFPSCPIFPRPPRRLGEKLETRTYLLMSNFSPRVQFLWLSLALASVQSHSCFSIGP